MTIALIQQMADPVTTRRQHYHGSCGSLGRDTRAHYDVAVEERALKLGFPPGMVPGYTHLLVTSHPNERIGTTMALFSNTNGLDPSRRLPYLPSNFRGGLQISVCKHIPARRAKPS